MEPLFFSMAGRPRAKGRPRATVRGAHAAVYTDADTRKYEASVTELARRAMGEQSPFEGPLSVSIRFRIPIPASASKRAKAAMAAGEVPPVSKPDIDNMAKAILDGMGEDAKRKKQGLDARVVFRSDAQIVRLFLTKEYAEKPGVDVRVEALAEPTP